MIATVARLLLTFGIAAFRIGGDKSPAFQAIAHLFVGALVGAWMVSGYTKYFWPAVLLSFVELACFLAD